MSAAAATPEPARSRAPTRGQIGLSIGMVCRSREGSGGCRPRTERVITSDYLKGRALKSRPGSGRQLRSGFPLEVPEVLDLEPPVARAIRLIGSDFPRRWGLDGGRVDPCRFDPRLR